MQESLHENDQVVEMSRKITDKNVILHATSLVNELSQLHYYVSNLKYNADKTGFTVFNKHLDHRLNEFCAEYIGIDDSHVYEWWIVNSWMAEKLKDKGEIILSTYVGDIWGRTNTGQAIFIDDTMLEIANELIQREV